LEEFRENYFPKLEVENNSPNLTNGVAASYYGVSSVGSTLHRCKYENGGDFPNFLIRLTLKAFRKTFGNEKFDMLLYVPPTESGNLVMNFATTISKILGIPISHELKKSRDTKPQKIFENSYLKHDNVRNVFVVNSPDKMRGKKILLIDDIFDSGSTIKEIGRILTNYGAEMIAPLTIAKTVGGDLKE